MSVPNSKLARILIVDDDPGMVQLVQALSTGAPTFIASAATLADGIRLAGHQRFDVIILDHLLPDGHGLDRVGEFIAQDRLRPILYITAQSGAHTAIEAIKRGAFDYLAKPLDFTLLKQRLAEALEYRRLTRLPVLVQGSEGEKEENDVLVGRCRAMQEVYKCIGRLASLSAPVLVEGEVGTGKEMIARAIHQYGPRAQAPFVKIGRDELVEAFRGSEMKLEAGHAPHALSEIFPQCAGGTLFLEELGELPSSHQVRLLSMLQRQVVAKMADVRVLLSSSVLSRQLLERGELRSDLYYFLTPYTIRVPALREREDDFELLVAHFMQRLALVSATSENQGPPRVSPAALALLHSYDWPGNVAQLKSVLQCVLMESRGAVLATDALHRALEGGEREAPQSVINSDHCGISNAAWDLTGFARDRLRKGTDRLYDDAIAEMERTLLKLVLQHTHGNQAQAAKFLGMTRTSLRKKIAISQIDLSQLSNGEPAGVVDVPASRNGHATEPAHSEESQFHRGSAGIGD